MGKKQATSEKIMAAAIDLIAARGYNGVTTEEIATKAGFSEKTLFRHFHSKQNLLEAAFHHYHYAQEMQLLFTNMTWDLAQDLLMISRNYHRIMHQNRQLILISLKEKAHLPGFQATTHKHPEQLKALLTDYFSTMQQRGRVCAGNPERQAVTFLYANYGAALGRINQDPIMNAFTIEAFIEESVALFTRALTPT